MRITVGGFLLGSSLIGGCYFWFPSRYKDLIKVPSDLEPIRQRAGVYIPFLRSKAAVSPQIIQPIPTEAAPPPAPVVTESVVESVPAVISENTLVVLEAEAVVEPVQPKVVAKPTPAKKPTARNSRRKRTAKAKKKTPAPKAQAQVQHQAKPQPVAASPTGDALVGTYVSVQLKTGRDVRGIYASKSATHYKIELPGLGPFEYPVDNVVSIKPAE